MKLAILTMIIFISVATSIGFSKSFLTHQVKAVTYSLIYTIKGGEYENHDLIPNVDYQRFLNELKDLNLFSKIDRIDVEIMPEIRDPSTEALVMTASTNITFHFSEGSVRAEQKLFTKEDASKGKCGTYITRVYMADTLYDLIEKNKKNIVGEGGVGMGCLSYVMKFYRLPLDILNTIIDQ